MCDFFISHTYSVWTKTRQFTIKTAWLDGYLRRDSQFDENTYDREGLVDDTMQKLEKSTTVWTQSKPVNSRLKTVIESCGINWNEVQQIDLSVACQRNEDVDEVPDNDTEGDDSENEECSSPTSLTWGDSTDEEDNE